MAAIDTFIDARRRVNGRRIHEIHMAGHHLTAAHRHENVHLSALCLDLADAHARAAVMLEEVQATYNGALEALYERAEIRVAEEFWQALNTVDAVAA
jgi:hypothetical protein